MYATHNVHCCICYVRYPYSYVYIELVWEWRHWITDKGSEACCDGSGVFEDIARLLQKWQRELEQEITEQIWGILKGSFHLGKFGTSRPISGLDPYKVLGLGRSASNKEIKRSQHRREKPQRKPIGLAIRAYLRLEVYRLRTGISWFEAKTSIIRDAIRSYLAHPVYTLPRSTA